MVFCCSHACHLSAAAFYVSTFISYFNGLASMGLAAMQIREESWVAAASGDIGLRSPHSTGPFGPTTL
jgi:hypothetical protein